MRLFSEKILPLRLAHKSGDHFALARIAKMHSPLLSKEVLQNSPDQLAQLKRTSESIAELMLLWQADNDPTLLTVLRSVAQNGLFAIHDALHFHLSNDLTSNDLVNTAENSQDDPIPQATKAIGGFLSVPFSQVENYVAYITGNSKFDTHQGVKGLEFERVMVIMDDVEARGFSFKYESLFGGGGGSIEATRRLFYVTCSRAERSLALVAYTNEPERVRQYVLEQGWFHESEIILPEK